MCFLENPAEVPSSSMWLRRSIAVVPIAVLAISMCIATGGCSSSPLPGERMAPKFGLSSTSSSRAPVTTSTPDAADTQPTHRLQSFDAGRAMSDVRALEGFGVRVAGSPAERRAATYIARRLREMGYSASLVDVPLGNGRTSTNVVARKRGHSDRIVVLGAHYDSKSPSPGANDNLTGTAALLEIARIFSAEPVVPTVEFVFFGAEETIDDDPNHHHFGSRHHVARMSPAEKDSVAAMLSVDMIGVGHEFAVRTMGVGTKRAADRLRTLAGDRGWRLVYLRDVGPTGWSDHEAFELAGIPAAWIEWRNDPVYHTAKDRSGHLNERCIEQAGQLTLDFVRSMDEDKLEAWTAR